MGETPVGGIGGRLRDGHGDGHQKSLQHLKDAEATYLEITTLDPARFKLIECVRDGQDLGRNSLRKDNAYFSLDWRLQRPFRIGASAELIPIMEMFNTFNNKNNVNPLVSPALFDFNGFLRLGVGDPRQMQISVKFTF